MPKNNTSPRGYLSFSQFSLFERSPALYHQHYIEGWELPENKYMRLGKRLAEARERGHDKDPTLDFLARFMPSYPKREYKIEVEFEKIPLLGKLDGYNPWKKSIGEDKSGKNFTQGMADKSDQLTLYSLMIWKKLNYIPRIDLHWARTEEIDGILRLTGDFRTFTTTRTLKDFILISKRLKIAWERILEMGKELQ